MNANDKNETQTMIDRTVAEAFRYFYPSGRTIGDVAKFFESRAAARVGEGEKPALNPCAKCGSAPTRLADLVRCENDDCVSSARYLSEVEWNAANPPPAKPVERRYGVGARFVSRGKTRTASLAIHTNANQGPRLFILFSDGYCRFVQHGYTTTLSEIFGYDADRWQPVESESQEPTP